MRKVAIVYARFGPYHVARLRGAEEVLSQHGWEVIGLEVCPDDDFYAWKKVDEHSDVRRLALFPKRSYSEIPRAAITKKMKQTLRSENPKVVVSPGWYYSESLAAARWCRRNDRVSILMSESWRDDRKRRWWREIVKRYRIRLFDAAIVGGRKHAEYLTGLGMPRDRIEFGHNVVDNVHFKKEAAFACANASSLRKKFELPQRYILASGRFLPRKNFKRLLIAYRQYRTQCPSESLSLVICGDGPLSSELRNLAEKLGISGSVHWPGFVQYDALPYLYGLAECFVIPSTAEPWGLVVNEAMASGLPVLMSRQCGATELLRDGVNGYGFDPFDPDSIRSALTEFSRLDSRAVEKMRRASIETVAAWGPSRFGKGILGAIRSVMDLPSEVHNGEIG